MLVRCTPAADAAYLHIVCLIATDHPDPAFLEPKPLSREQQLEALDKER